MKVEPGLYQHFKGNVYEVLFTAVQTETGEELVIYRSLNDTEKIWARPASMWMETVERDEYTGPRFVPVPDITALFEKEGEAGK